MKRETFANLHHTILSWNVVLWAEPKEHPQAMCGAGFRSHKWGFNEAQKMICLWMWDWFVWLTTCRYVLLVAVLSLAPVGILYYVYKAMGAPERPKVRCVFDKVFPFWFTALCVECTRWIACVASRAWFLIFKMGGQDEFRLIGCRILENNLRPGLICSRTLSGIAIWNWTNRYSTRIVSCEYDLAPRFWHRRLWRNLHTALFFVQRFGLEAWHPCARESMYTGGTAAIQMQTKCPITYSN